MRRPRFTFITTFIGVVWWFFDHEIGSIIILTAIGQRALEYLAETN